MIDSLDKKILNVMQADCRKSFREIAKEVESTTVTVINRVNKMEAAGIIRGYSSDIDYSKLGYGLTAMVAIIASDRQALKKLESQLTKKPNILDVYEVTGEIDVVVIGKFKDIKDLQNFVKEDILATGIAKKTVSSIVTSVYKEEKAMKI